MSKRVSEKDIGETKKKKLKKGLSIDEAKTEIVKSIVTEINELLNDQTQVGDSTDGVITLFQDIFQPILDEFKELIGESKDKKNFIRGLITIFTIFTFKHKNTSSHKNKKGNQDKCKNCPGTMARTKATVRRLNRPMFVAVPGQKIGNKNIMNRR